MITVEKIVCEHYKVMGIKYVRIYVVDEYNSNTQITTKELDVTMFAYGGYLSSIKWNHYGTYAEVKK
jgi:hypothetical protein